MNIISLERLEPGYILTPIAVVASAIQILEEKVRA
jgi:hypothetical protein